MKRTILGMGMILLLLQVGFAGKDIQIETFSEEPSAGFETAAASQSSPGAAVGLLKVYFKGLSSEPKKCTATLILLEWKYFAVTAARCTKPSPQLKIIKVEFVPDYPLNTIPLIGQGVVRPSGWTGKEQAGQNIKNNYALVRLPLPNFKNNPGLQGHIHPAVVVGARDENNPLSKQDLQGNIALYGYNDSLQKKDIVVDKDFKEGYENSAGRIVFTNFKTRTDLTLQYHGLMEGSPVSMGGALLITDRMWPELIGLTTDAGMIIPITQKMYNQFVAVARKGEAKP
ncbi:MAG: hypothetical protein HY559_06860 [Gammaproteobacteria bacterium]|nr:hypothetical protein [Gammaproteobacteria bacterium]